MVELAARKAVVDQQQRAAFEACGLKLP